MRFQVQHRVPAEFGILLNYFVQNYTLIITLTSATQMQPEVQLLVEPQLHLFMKLYVDLEVLLQLPFQVYYQVHPVCTIKCTSNAFIFLFVLSCASPGALKSSLLLSFFNQPNFTSICTLMSLFKSILQCVLYTLLFAISVTSFGGAIDDFSVAIYVTEDYIEFSLSSLDIFNVFNLFCLVRTYFCLFLKNFGK